MRREPDTQDLVFSEDEEPGDETGVAANNRVIDVRRHADQLGTPAIVQRVMELRDQVEDLLRGVAIEQEDGDQVEILEDAVVADALEQLEE